LDLTYVPSTDQEKQLFCLKQDFLFGVFVATMKVSQLHSVVKKHTNDLDTQKVHVALLELLQESTHANVKSADILEYITSIWYDASLWKGTTGSAWLVPVGTSLTPLHRRFGTSSMTSLRPSSLVVTLMVMLFLASLRLLAAIIST
jgi:hypothetical protein